MTKVYSFKICILHPFLFLMITSMPVFSAGQHRSLKINTLIVPSPIVEGDSILLKCDYDLGDEALYSVKFYFNHEEFYRYVPDSEPSIRVYSQAGVKVDVSKSGNNSVYLQKMSLEDSGNYTCEVSTGPPFFRTEERTKQLKVEGARHHIPMKINTLLVPSPAVEGESILLKCDYELGDETFYSVKFYRDDVEFFRYVPKDKPQISFFPLSGVNVDVSKSGDSFVYLEDLSLSSSGNYTCEVSSDAPYFRTDAKTKQLEVIGFWHHNPMKINTWHVPSPAVAGDSILLKCYYELGDQTLSSVKFYKDEVEFFRYVPKDTPQISAFPLDGVDVDVSKSGDGFVYLRNLSLTSSGYYTCEVSTDADAQYFGIHAKTKQLEVIGPSFVTEETHKKYLKINMLDVPSPVEAGENILLKCDYELGNEALYAVKFYKNMEEFYRYDPRNKPSIMIFPQAGLKIDVSKSGENSVYLRDLSLESSGNYTCEVSTDAPSFDSVEATKELEVLGKGMKNELKNLEDRVVKCIKNEVRESGDAKGLETLGNVNKDYDLVRNVVQDADEMFLLSQLPCIKKMKKNDKFQFQIQLLKLIQQYSNETTC